MRLNSNFVALTLFALSSFMKKSRGLLQRNPRLRNHAIDLHHLQFLAATGWQSISRIGD